MKILHTSDIHLDSPLTARLPADKIRERRRELLIGFSRLITEAQRLGVGGIIIAGDLFDSERVSKKAMTTALDAIEAARDITFFYLPGNHEGEAMLSAREALPKNLLIFGNEWTYFGTGDVTVVGRREICEGMFDSLVLDRNKKNIVVLHGELRDRTASPDKIGISEASDRGIDYLALGHYHSYSAVGIDDRGAAVYSGTPEGRGFDEAGDKGFVLLSTDSGGVVHSFVKFARRTLHILPLDISGIQRTSDLYDRVASRVARISREDIVRVELVGGYHPGLLKDIDGLTADFSDRFYYFEVKDSSRIAINPDDYKNDKSLKGEFIRLVSADTSLDEVTKGKIIACGINALMGEEPV